MHDEFHRLLQGRLYDLLTKSLEGKLAAEGVSLNRSERAALRRTLEQYDGSGIRFQLDRGPDNRKISLRLTDADLSEIETQLNNVLESLPATIDSAADDMARRIHRGLDRKWKAKQKRQRRESERFAAHLYRHWREPLSELEQLIYVVSELGESINHRLRAQHLDSRPFAVEVQTRLHARACQVAREVLTLLSAGFAEGAIARWRTLHEVAVVSFFIGGDENLAERYWLHEAVESRRAAHEYRRNTARLGLEPMTELEIAELDEDVASLNKRFGSEYSGQYGWAASKLRSTRAKVTFGQIEEVAKLHHLRLYYRLASHTVHANPKGAFYRLGLLDQSAVLLAGPSDYGLADPGQNTAISLAQVTSALATLEPTLDNIVGLKTILIMVDQIGENFVRTQRGLDVEAAQRAEQSAE